MDRAGSIPYVPVSSRYAGVAELVDARDSKSRFLGSVGSSPTTRTTFLQYLTFLNALIAAAMLANRATIVLFC